MTRMLNVHLLRAKYQRSLSVGSSLRGFMA